MRRNPYYILKEIGESYYLVPFGQAIEDRAATVRVNEVTAFLWGELKDCGDVTSLAGRLSEEYEVASEEEVCLEEDVRNLMQNLKWEGIVLDGYLQKGDVPESETDTETVTGGNHLRFPETKNSAQCEEAIIRFMEIAGISIRFCGKPEFFSENFEPFCVDGSGCSDVKKENALKTGENNNCNTRRAEDSVMKDSGAEICVSVTEDDPPGYGELPLVLQGRMVTIHDGGDFYIMRSAEMPHLREVHIGKEGSPAIVYIKKMETGSDSRESMEGRGVYEQKPVIRGSDNRYGFELPTPAESVFHAIRHAFLLKAQKLGMYVIHSASILYKGKAWLFSALSGVGKSTHADIWRRLYKTPYLNGDLNLLAFENGRLMVKGIPWCGTSGIFTTETYPLGGIILIARNERNYIEEPGEEAQIFGIQMRFISPKWDAEQTSESLDFAQRVAGMVRIARMHCNIEDEAAEVCRAWIDGSGDEE